MDGDSVKSRGDKIQKATHSAPIKKTKQLMTQGNGISYRMLPKPHAGHQAEKET